MTVFYVKLVDTKAYAKKQVTLVFGTLWQKHSRHLFTVIQLEFKIYSFREQF